jgi:hypothetical protein
VHETVNYGDIKVIPCGRGEFKQLTIEPTKGFDVGKGNGQSLSAKLEGGTVGIMVDARGRPFQLPTDDATRLKKLRDWLQAMGLPLPG